MIRRHFLRLIPLIASLPIVSRYIPASNNQRFYSLRYDKVADQIVCQDPVVPIRAWGEIEPDSVSVWNRALSPEEIEYLQSGPMRFVFKEDDSDPSL